MSSKLPLSQYLPNVSNIAYGCMGLGGDGNTQSLTKRDIAQAHQVVETALESEINFFDHADIYCKGKAEQVFGRILKSNPRLRERCYIQSKCGIRLADEYHVGRYDFSAKWVTQSVEGILSRLHIEQLDILMLHRPDPLLELSELVATLEALHNGGKVRHFAVSNMNHHQIAYLTSELKHPIIANQLEMSLAKLEWLDQGVSVNVADSRQIDFPVGTLEYCQLNSIQLQAWGCLAQGRFSDPNAEYLTPHQRRTAEYICQLAADYQVTAEAIILAFLMRHPVTVQPVIGTTNLARIKACTVASDIRLTREQWYKLYVLARGNALP